jgi:hypothetical protein
MARHGVRPRCRNPRCNAFVARGPLCSSCWRAGSWVGLAFLVGALGLAFLVGALLKLAGVL